MMPLQTRLSPTTVLIRANSRTDHGGGKAAVWLEPFHRDRVPRGGRGHHMFDCEHCPQCGLVMPPQFRWAPCPCCEADDWGAVIEDAHTAIGKRHPASARPSNKP